MPADKVVLGYEELLIDQSLCPPISDLNVTPVRDGEHRYNPTVGIPQYAKLGVWVDYGTGAGGGIITGTATFTGDGLTSQFLIPHAQPGTPTDYTIDAVSPAAQGIYSRSADATNLIVNYDVCPLGSVVLNFTIQPVLV